MILKTRPRIDQTYLLEGSPGLARSFGKLDPAVAASEDKLPEMVEAATSKTLWISYAPGLTAALLRQLASPTPKIGIAIIIHQLDSSMVPSLNHFFARILFSVGGQFLPPEELSEALMSANPSRLFIGGSVDQVGQTITLFRGDLTELVVPFSAFTRPPNGPTPDFSNLSILDSGLTIGLGDYEAAGDALLYEFDPQFRRQLNKERIKSEQTLGASIRRLRKQLGLRRNDFQPYCAKTIARIESNQPCSERALKVIAKRLGVHKDDLGTY